MSKTQIIRQGEALPFSFDRAGEPLTNFACTIEVKKYPSDTALISRAITETTGEYTGYLTQTETAALNTGDYYLIAKLANTQTDQEEIVTSRFKVTEAWS